MYLKNTPDVQYIIADVEGNGLKPTKLWCMVVNELDTGNIIELVGEQAIRDYINEHQSAIWIGHNFLSYDMPNCNRLLGTNIPISQVVDTLVLSYLYDPGLQDEFGKHAIEAYGGRFGIPKLGHDDWTHFSPEMLARCRRDVEITTRLFRVLRAKMAAVGFSEMSCEIEHGIRQVIDWQEEHGFYFQAAEAGQFYAELRQKEAIFAAEVHKHFPPELRCVATLQYRTKSDGEEFQTVSNARTRYARVSVKDDKLLCYNWKEFNLGSPKQRVERLLAIGYVPVNYTKKTKKGGGGQPQVDEDGIMAFLETCDEAAKPAVEAIAKWLVVNARANMVGAWIDFVDVKDRCIHGRVFSCGAGSRRCTHNHPNTANVPSNEALYGPECRHLWTARPGRVLLGGDAKAVQMRMFAHYLGNVEVGLEYAEGDPHKRNAEAAGIPRKKVKNCFYAMIFGSQDPRLGKTGYGSAGTPAQGARIRQALYGTTPGLEGLFATADRAYRKGGGWLECVDGGWVRCPSPHAALNYWIQSAEAVLMKLTAIKVFKFIIVNALDAWQVGFIHDELQYDCKDIPTAIKVSEYFLKAIREAGEELKFIIPMAGDCKFGLTWKDTH